jgi:hypothetical protein
VLLRYALFGVAGSHDALPMAVPIDGCGVYGDDQ